MLLYALALPLGALGVLVVHELGHLLVARAFGVNALTVTIGVGPTVVQFTDSRGTRWKLGLLLFGAGCGFPDGPVAHDGSRSIRNISLRRRAITFLAGPLANATLAVALFLATYIQDNSFSIGRYQAAETSLTFLIGGFSLAVALFNLLPVPPLDGGRLILLAFEAFTGREISRESEKQIFTSGLVVLSIAGALAVLFFVAAQILRLG